ncbi:MAG TPA: hypothetical protein VK039_07930, partial [Brevibacterium sp.]|nr:hypothetical protein [Brevibacterium sp.]
MADLLLAAVAALIAGGCTLALAVIVARVIREGVVYPDARDAVRAALDETGAWTPYRCECGEWVWSRDDECAVGSGPARERVCPGCHEAAYGEADRADRYEDMRLHAALDGGRD